MRVDGISTRQFETTRPVSPNDPPALTPGLTRPCSPANPLHEWTLAIGQYKAFRYWRGLMR